MNDGHDNYDTRDDGHTVVSLMERSMDGVQAPVDRLRATALSRGRSLRRRRRVGAVAGGVAAAAVVGLALPHLATGARSADDTPVASQGPTAVDSPSPPTGNGDTGWWDMPAPEMRDRLAEILPDGIEIESAETWNNDRAPGEPSSVMHGYLVANLSHAGVDGQGGLNMVFYSPEALAQSTADVPSPDPSAPDHPTATLAAQPARDAHLSCPGNLTGPHQCSLVRDVDGDVIARKATYVSGDIEILSVDYLTDDGAIVYVCVANTVDEKWGPGSEASASEPPLTVDELVDIAEDPTWQDRTPPAG